MKQHPATKFLDWLTLSAMFLAEAVLAVAVVVCFFNLI